MARYNISIVSTANTRGLEAGARWVDAHRRGIKTLQDGVRGFSRVERIVSQNLLQTAKNGNRLEMSFINLAKATTAVSRAADRGLSNSLSRIYNTADALVRTIPRVEMAMYRLQQATIRAGLAISTAIVRNLPKAIATLSKFGVAITVVAAAGAGLAVFASVVGGIAAFNRAALLAAKATFALAKAFLSLGRTLTGVLLGALSRVISLFMQLANVVTATATRVIQSVTRLAAALGQMLVSAATRAASAVGGALATAMNVAVAGARRLTGAVLGAANAMRHMAGRVAAGAGALGLLGFAAAAKEAVTFEKQLAIINTIARESDEVMAQFGDGMRRIASETGVVLSDVTTAVYDLLSANLGLKRVGGEVIVDIAGSLKLVEDASHLAVGGLGTVDETLDLLTTVINSFGLKTRDSTDIVNVWAKSIELGKVTASELGVAISTIAPILAAMGGDFKEVAAGIAVMTQKGFTAAKATVTMRAFLIGLQRNIGPLEDMQKETGIDLKKLVDEKGMKAAAMAVRAYSEQTGTDIIKMLGRVEAVQWVLGVTGKNAKAFDQAMKEMKRSLREGTAFEQFMRRFDTVERAFGRLRESLRSLAIELGEPLLKPIARFFNVLANGIQNLTNFFQRFPDLTTIISQVGSLASVILGLRGGAMALMFILGPMGGAFSLFAIGASGLLTTLSLLLTPVAALVSLFIVLENTGTKLPGRIAAITVPFEFLNQEIAPLIQNIRDLIGLFFDLQDFGKLGQRNEQMRIIDDALEAGEIGRKKAKALRKAIRKDAFETLVPKGTDIYNNRKAQKKYVESMFSAGLINDNLRKRMMRSIKADPKDNILTRLWGKKRDLKKSLQDRIDELIGELRDNLTRALKAIPDAVGWLGLIVAGWLTDAFTWAANNLPSMITDFMPSLETIVGTIGDAIGTAFGGLQTIGELIGKLLFGDDTVDETTGQKNTGLVGALQEWVQEAVNWLTTDGIAEITNGLGQLAGDWWTWLTTDVIPTVGAELGKWVDEVITWASNTDIGQAIGEIANNFWTWLTGENGVVNTVSTEFDRIITEIGVWAETADIGAELEKLATNAWNWLTGEGSEGDGAIGELRARLNEVLEKVGTWADNHSDEFYEALSGLAAGVGNFIGDKVLPAILSGLGTIGQAVQDAIADLFDGPEEGELVFNPDTYQWEQAGPSLGQRFIDGFLDVVRTLPDRIAEIDIGDLSKVGTGLAAIGAAYFAAMFTAKAAAKFLWLALSPTAAAGGLVDLAIKASGKAAGIAYMGAKGFLLGIGRGLVKLFAMLAGTSAAAGATGGALGGAATAGGIAGKSWGASFFNAAKLALGPLALVLLAGEIARPFLEEQNEEVTKQKEAADKYVAPGMTQESTSIFGKYAKLYKDAGIGDRDYRNTAGAVNILTAALVGLANAQYEVNQGRGANRSGGLLDQMFGSHETWAEKVDSFTADIAVMMQAVGDLNKLSPELKTGFVKTINQGFRDMGLKGEKALKQLNNGTIVIRNKFAEKFPEMTRILQSFGLKTAEETRKVKNKVKSVGDSVDDLKPSSGDEQKLYGWGERLMGEWWAGIKSKWQTVKTFFNTIISKVKRFLGVESPPKHPTLRPIRQWGFNLVGEWAAGISEGVNGPLDAALASMTGKVAAAGGQNIQGPQISAALARQPIPQGMDAGFQPAATGSLVEIAALLREQNRQVLIQNQLIAQMVSAEPGAAEPVTARGELAKQAFLMPGGRV